MPNIVIAGAQWGDEGKGKVVDLLTHNVQVVARYNGGHNAGHTLLVSDDPGESSSSTSRNAALRPSPST